MATPVFNMEYWRAVSLLISSSFSRHLASTRRESTPVLEQGASISTRSDLIWKGTLSPEALLHTIKTFCTPIRRQFSWTDCKRFKEMSSAQILPVSPKSSAIWVVLPPGAAHISNTAFDFSTLRNWATFMAEISCTKNNPSGNPGISETAMLSTTTALSMAYELIPFFPINTINSWGDIFLWLMRRNAFWEDLLVLHISIVFSLPYLLFKWNLRKGGNKGIEG